VSAGLALNWWAVGLRGLATIIFGLVVILLLPSSTAASFVMLFAACVAADGCFAILAAMLAANGRAKRWWTLILEGLIDLVLAANARRPPTGRGDHRHAGAA
jgi:uncharacterized membrane protein HdeD (DUF308 family)